MKTKIAVLALIAVTAGVFTYKQTKHIPPSDLRDAVGDVSDSGTGIADVKKVNVDLPAPKANEDISRSYAPTTNAITWVTIPGGTFMMGSTGKGQDFENAKPIHKVTVKTFRMSKTEVTVGQYSECVYRGACKAPYTRHSDKCNWGKPERRFYPINCVNWVMAEAYAKFVGARLPSESQWEYAARSAGKNLKYPWGNEKPTDDKAVICVKNDLRFCGTTMPVCSKPAGNTKQGLCDMAGNVEEWIDDQFESSYEYAHGDGSASYGSGMPGSESYTTVVRGGSYYSVPHDYRLQTAGRFHGVMNEKVTSDDVGFRIVK